MSNYWLTHVLWHQSRETSIKEKVFLCFWKFGKKIILKRKFKNKKRKARNKKKMMATYRSLVPCLSLILIVNVIVSNGLQCHRCGEYNDGVGSITPCLNYTEQNAHTYFKECPRKTDKFCVVSENSLNYWKSQNSKARTLPIYTTIYHCF